MGHIDGKGLYKRLANKIDNLTVRVPRDEKLYAVLKEIYTSEEADLVVRMPYRMSDIDRLAEVTGYDKEKLRRLLEGLCRKGLVIDIFANEQYYYAPSPMIIGIYEFSMMRTGQGVDSRKLAGLFHEYLDRPDFWAMNLQDGAKTSVIRTLPHEGTIRQSEHIEILDYERATAIVESATKFSIGICSCRHEKLHVGEKTCDVPLEKCSSLGFAADYLIRNKLAREASKTEMLENLARSKEMGLVLNADNVKSNVTFICHCCRCCCHPLLGISKFGYPNAIVTSSFIAESDNKTCKGCGMCASACPINAISMISEISGSKPKKRPDIDASICLGCGVCALSCKTGAIKLMKRKKRVIHPENTFERVILQSLEKGTLHNQLFDNPHSLTQKVLKGIVGGFLRLPPIKKAIMSDTLRSRFLSSLKAGIENQGKGWMLKL